MPFSMRLTASWEGGAEDGGEGLRGQVHALPEFTNAVFGFHSVHHLF